MKAEEENPSQEKMIADFENKQRNIVFPEAMRNARGVDEYLWKGSPDAPLVQRIGAWIFGCFFILMGIAFLDVVYEKGDKLFGLLSIGSFLLGLRLIRNGFRRHKAKPPRHS